MYDDLFEQSNSIIPYNSFVFIILFLGILFNIFLNSLLMFESIPPEAIAFMFILLPYKDAKYFVSPITPYLLVT